MSGVFIFLLLVAAAIIAAIVLLPPNTVKDIVTPVEEKVEDTKPKTASLESCCMTGLDEVDGLPCTPYDKGVCDAEITKVCNDRYTGDQVEQCINAYSRDSDGQRTSVFSHIRDGDKYLASAENLPNPYSVITWSKTDENGQKWSINNGKLCIKDGSCVGFGEDGVLKGMENAPEWTNDSGKLCYKDNSKCMVHDNGVIRPGSKPDATVWTFDNIFSGMLL